MEKVTMTEWFYRFIQTESFHGKEGPRRGKLYDLLLHMMSRGQQRAPQPTNFQQTAPSS